MVKRLIVFLLLNTLSYNTFANMEDRVGGLIEGVCPASVPVEIVKRIITHESKSFFNGEVQPWPWTLNINGVGYYYNTKKEALEAALQALDEDVKKLGIGFGQLEWKYHGQRADWNLAKALDPANNVKMVCDILVESRKSERVKNWADAIAYYHRPVMDKLGRDYASKVLAL